jgi:hypothetical protein
LKRATTIPNFLPSAFKFPSIKFAIILTRNFQTALIAHSSTSKLFKYLKQVAHSITLALQIFLVFGI